MTPLRIEIEPTQTHDSRPVVRETRTEGGTVDADSTVPTQADASGTFLVPGYRILGELGRGGMGIVYDALHVALNRPTALKMIRSGEAPDSRDMIRFLAEAEAVASIKNPHVVPVYEFGTAGERPFLALERCSGGTLADRFRAKSITTPRDAAMLLRKVALGVAAAHDLGIVHRDLKPGNVLFDAAGEPKVADFGLAKRQAGADLTATQAVMGSPAYMAPEQARGESKFVGPQADVWALGVMLYEALAGQRPFVADDSWSVMQKVIRDEPPGLRTINRGVPPDLERVVRKCLAKAPHERYATAGELAADLDCWLAGKPVSARPAAWPERTVKWIRRNPLPTALAASLLTGTIVSLAFGIVAVREANRARVEKKAKDDALEDLRDEKRNVEEKYAVTIAALNAMSDEVVEKNFTQQARPLGRDEKAFLNKLIALYDDATKDRGDSRDAMIARAMARMRTSRMRFVLGDLATAEADLRGAIDTFRELTAVSDCPVTVRQEYGRCRSLLGTILANRGKSTEAIAELKAGSVIREALFRERPNDLVAILALADSQHDLAKALREAGDAPGALAAFREARDSFVSALPLQPANAPLASGIAEWRYKFARARDAYAVLLRENNRFAEADVEIRAARAMQEEILKQSPGEPMWRWSLAVIRFNIGNTFVLKGESANAVPELQAAMEIALPLVAEYPGVPLYRQMLGLCQSSLAMEYQDLKQPDKCEPLFAASVATRRRAVEDAPESAQFHGEHGQGLTNYAYFRRSQNDPAKALALFEEAWPHLLKARQGFPQNRYWRQVAQSNRIPSLRLTAATDNVDRIVAIADELIEHGTNRSVTAFACLAPLDEATKRLASADPRKADRLREQSLKCLTVIADSGYAKTTIFDEPVLEPLKDRPEYKAFEAKIRENAAKAEQKK